MSSQWPRSVIKKSKQAKSKPQKINKIKEMGNTKLFGLAYHLAKNDGDTQKSKQNTKNEFTDLATLKRIEDHAKTLIVKCTDCARSAQIGGDHYKNMKVQPWDAIQASMRPQEFLAYLRGTAIAYLMRCQDLPSPTGKQSVQDVEKAIHTLQKYMEVAKEWLSEKP